MRERDEGGRKFIGEEEVGTMEWAEFGWTNEIAGCGEEGWTHQRREGGSPNGMGVTLESA